MTCGRSKICSLFLVLALMPGTFEIMENIVHFVTEGHLAHLTADADHHDPSGSEHGCTPIFHACGCHTSLSFLGEQTLPSVILSRTGFAGRFVSDFRAAGFRLAIERPPQA